jgi:putative peptidoglycan lipid II flippase
MVTERSARLNADYFDLPAWDASIGTLEAPGAPTVSRERSNLASAGKSISIVGLAFVASRLLGLLRDVILGYRFGTSSEFDAYVSAFRIPDLLFLVVMSGAFGAAFIPVFGGFLERDDREGAWQLASAVITYAAITTVVFALVIFALAGPLMRNLVAPDLPPDAQDLAVKLMRILLLSPIFLGLGIAAKGILEAQNEFTLPALSPLLYNLAIILGALALAPSFGIEGVAVGVVVGALLHIAVQVPGLVNSGIRLVPTFDRSVAGLAEVGRLLLPRVIGLAAFQLNFIAVTHLASGAGDGRVSALNYAWQMMMLPHGVIALSISTVIFPTMARLFQTGKLDEMRSTFTSALMPMLFLTIPASIGLFELRTAIPQTVFQLGGNFDSTSTLLVSPALGYLAVGLVWYALVEVLARIYYAMQDTKTPVIAGVVIIVINIVLGAVLVDRMGHAGLALALSVSTGIEALILFVVLRARIGGLDDAFGSWIGRVMIATAAMTCMAELVRPKLERATSGGLMNRIAQLIMLGWVMALLAGTYFLVSCALRVPEADRALAMIRAKAPASLRPLLGGR